jgi:hypothetical protein
MIQKFKDYKKESNAIEGLTEYELQIKNMYSDFEKGIGDGLLDLGKVDDVSKIDIANIQKTYPKSNVIQKNGRYCLSIKENPVNESAKVSDAIIEIFVLLTDELGDKLEQDTIEKSVIDDVANEILPNAVSEDKERGETLLGLYNGGSKEFVYDMIENDYLVKINESEEQQEEEDEDDDNLMNNRGLGAIKPKNSLGDKDDDKNIFDDREDDDYDEENLERGEDIQKEHEPTYTKIKKFLELTDELPPEDDFYKSITKDHMDEPDGVGELYYDEEEGLDDFEEELKDEWEERQGKDDDDDDDDKTGRKYDEDEENLIVQQENKIIKFDIFENKIEETVNFDIVEDSMQQIRDRFTPDDIFTMIEENKADYDEPESQTINDIINSVSDGNISIDDYTELSNRVSSEFGL